MRPYVGGVKMTFQNVFSLLGSICAICISAVGIILVVVTFACVIKMIINEFKNGKNRR